MTSAMKNAMRNEGSARTDQQLDRALRETLGEASVPTLSYDFRQRLSAEIETQQPKVSRKALWNRRHILLVTLVVLYVLIGALGAPWLAGRPGGQPLPAQVTVVLLTAAVFSSITALSMTLLYLARRRT